mgnify:CR=1 FL=1
MINANRRQRHVAAGYRGVSWLKKGVRWAKIVLQASTGTRIEWHRAYYLERNGPLSRRSWLAIICKLALYGRIECR